MMMMMMIIILITIIIITLSLTVIRKFIFVISKHSVYCAVGTEFLYIILINFLFPIVT
jgi:hypothetical protein